MAKKPTKNSSVAEEVLAGEQKKGRKYVPKHTAAADIEDPVAPPPAVKAAPRGLKKSRAELQKLSTDGDLVDIWERRILNPDHRESLPIRITTPGMRLRWINLSNRGRFQRARYEQGWVPVHKSELMDEREISGASFTTEGYVCRGEKQGEMLMKIPLAVYKQIQKRRADLNTASYKKLRENMGSAGYQHFKEKLGGSAGDQAEEAASKFKGEIKFGTDRVSSDELFE
jgi:hypothetical protein